MCGIAGVVSSWLSAKEKAIFCDLLRVNTLRGTHSTGIIAALREKDRVDYCIDKSTRNAVAFLAHPSKQTKAIFADNRVCSALIGHTRSATKGSIRTENAHPFVFPRVIGVHNGTINTDLEHEKEYDTDSEALYRSINDRGLVEALRGINKGYPGYALAMVDRQKNEFIAIRNLMRPLHFTFNEKETTLFFSSEAEALRMVLARHNATYKGQVYPQLRDDVAMTVPLSPSGLEGLRWDTLDVNPPRRVHYGTGHNHFGPYSSFAEAWDGIDWDDKKPDPNKEVTLPKVTPPKASNVVSLPAPPKVHNKGHPKDQPALNTMSKSQRKKLQKALHKQAKVSAMLAKQAAEQDPADNSPSSFSEESAPGFLKQAQAAHEKIRRYFKPRGTDNPKSISEQSALFDDVALSALAEYDALTPEEQEERDRLDNEADHKAGISDDHLPFNDTLPWEDIDPNEDAEDDDESKKKTETLYRGYNGVYLDESTMEDRLIEGCQSCNIISDLDELDNIVWTSAIDYLCNKCASDPQLAGHYGYNHGELKRIVN